PRLMAQNVFRTIAMVDIEVDDGNAVQSMPVQGMDGAGRHIAEQAKPHGLATLGMVPRRAHGTKGIARRAGHDHIDCADDRTNGEQGRIQAVWAQYGLGIQRSQTLLGYGSHDGIYIAVIVNAFQPINRYRRYTWREQFAFQAG